MYKAVTKETPILAQAQQSLKKGYRYVIDTTESTFEAIGSGKIKLATEKSEKMFAQIREDNGYYGSKLPIKKELFRKGIDPVQMTNALQMKALQEQLQVIADQISMIDHSVREVLQGRQNDRIGLYQKRHFSLLLQCSRSQATMLRAGIYCNAGKLAAMSTVLGEYSRFIEGTVANNAALLTQCDTTDNGTEEGVWKSRTKLKLDVSDFAKQLNKPEKSGRRCCYRNCRSRSREKGC